MNRLRIIPLDDAVVFPGMPVTLTVDVGDDERVLLVPRRENVYATVGVVAEVSERVRMAGRGFAVTLMGAHRATLGGASADQDGVLRVDYEARPDENPPAIQTRDLEREYRAVVDEILELRGDDGRIRAFVRSITERRRAGRHGRLLAGPQLQPEAPGPRDVRRRRAAQAVARSFSATGWPSCRCASVFTTTSRTARRSSSASTSSASRWTRSGRSSARRTDRSTEEYRQKMADAGMPDAVRQQAERELDRFERMGDSNAESSMIRTYLDWLLAVPWSKRSEDRLDPVHAAGVLDADHEGLDDVKRRITEYLAVRKLRAERGMAENRRSGVILTLIGPPGTGKTSIGESIARATGRQFVRMSLGGVRDEAEIRGHRRTYIGALPGRLVRALRDAGTMNPVIMLDEVDKIGADWRGDPSAALLEVLDPAQNHAFRDHYLDVELDLSQVLFVATANVAETIPAALYDRMEVIRFDGYTTEEKVAIARRHLWPRQIPPDLPSARLPGRGSR